MKKYIPYLLPALFLGWVFMVLKPAPRPEGFQTAEFGKLPVLLNGRFQPLDSVARNSLLVLSGRQTVRVEPAGPGERPKKLLAIEWLMELQMKPETADQRKVFRIDHPEVLSLLNLSEFETAPGQTRRKRAKYFALNQLTPRLAEFSEQADRIALRERAERLEPSQRNPFQKQVMKLYQNMALFQGLKNSLQPEGADDFAKDLEQYQASIAPGIAAIRQQQAGEGYDTNAFNSLLRLMGPYQRMARFPYQSMVPLLVPPAHPNPARDNWETVGTNLMQTVWSGRVHPAVQFYSQMSSAYRHGDPATFNRTVKQYQDWLSSNFQPEFKKGRQESFFNTLAPFYKSLVIYVLAFILACLSWLNMSPLLNRTSFHLIMVALLIHTVGLVFRMYLEGRPPVTNLYSSAIFIGWGAVILGLVLEAFYHDGIGSVTASCVGFVTLVIAHNLALGGDTMEMLRAVLDTNFWLATHVVAVTLGYAATFVAGFLAILYIVRGALTRSLSAASAKALVRMVYGVVCFATLFSFVGTVLGGIWADQSWGRFWGWDPKENGALLIVIWNAAFLHARWGKLFPERYQMAMPVFGNIVTSFSWFGVNMLGIGLHSYGFMDQAFKWLLAFDISQLLIIALAFLPLRYWRSFRPSGPDTTSPPRSEPVRAKRSEAVPAQG